MGTDTRLQADKTKCKKDSYKSQNPQEANKQNYKMLQENKMYHFPLEIWRLDQKCI